LFECVIGTEKISYTGEEMKSKLNAGIATCFHSVQGLSFLFQNE